MVVSGGGPDVLSASLSALFAGTIAILMTLLVERLGGRRGGVLATTPTTIIPAAVGIYNSSVDEASARIALFSVPCGLLANMCFLLAWRFFPRCLPKQWKLPKKLLVMVGASLLVWMCAAAILILFSKFVLGTRQVPVIIFGTLCALSLFAVGICACYYLPPTPSGRNRVPLWMHICRGLLAALAIGFSVSMAQLSELVAGVMSTFPAMFLTTMVGLWISQSEAVQAGAVGPMMLGSLSVSFFAMVFSVMVTSMGPYLGAFVSWIAAILFISAPVAGFLQWRFHASKVREINKRWQKNRPAIPRRSSSQESLDEEDVEMQLVVSGTSATTEGTVEGTADGDGPGHEPNRSSSTPVT